MPVKPEPKIKHNLINIDSNKNIYRVIDINYLFDIFANKKLVFVAPELWDDPYESFLKTCYSIEKLGLIQRKRSYENYSKLIFGQCWTSKSESDATWRIYSPNGNKVKIKTKVKKISDILSLIKIEDTRTYIGRVEYKSIKNIEDNIKNGLDNHHKSFFGENLIRNFYFVKRRDFTHEHEVRIIIDFRKSENFNEDRINKEYITDHNNKHLCFLNIEEPLELIDEIVFDPRMSLNLADSYKYCLRNKYGFKKRIYKSKIYNQPEIKNIISPIKMF